MEPTYAQEPSFVQTINGKPMQFYRTVRRRPNKNSLQPFVPYMVVTTYMVLCLLLLQLGRKTWPYYIADLITGLSCAALHHFKQPLLSFNLAIGYTVWNSIPGSLAAARLPTHSEFMRSLKIREPKDCPVECLICWDDDRTSAELPCGHKFCLPCIKLLTAGESFKNTCPTCRRQLFQVAERFLLAAMKGNFSCAVLLIARSTLEFSHEMMWSRYGLATVQLFLLSVVVGFITFGLYKVWLAGQLRTFWTGKPEVHTWTQLYVTGSVFFSSVVMTCTNLWIDYRRFG